MNEIKGNNIFLNKTELYDCFKSFLSKSSFNILNENISPDIYNLRINDTARKFEIHFILKNISGSGWSDKDEIKRIQVGNVKKNIVYTNKVRTHFLGGIINYNEKNILIVWNSYRYLNHETNRSCYVNLESIKTAFEKGYYYTNDFEQEIWLCDEYHFNLLIRDYINFNYME